MTIQILRDTAPISLLYKKTPAVYILNTKQTASSFMTVFLEMGEIPPQNKVS